MCSLYRSTHLMSSKYNSTYNHYCPNNWQQKMSTPYGAFPLHGTVRFGTARYGSARLGTVRLSSGRFAFPPQFSTAIEWAGLFTRRYNCAASTTVTSS